MYKICKYIEADELKCSQPICHKQKHCKRHTCSCGKGKPSFLVKCKDCSKTNLYLPS